MAELEAPQTRATQVASQGAAAFELSGESSVPAESDVQAASFSAGSDSLLQANPWPFYLDDASSTTQAYEIRQPSDVTSGTDHQIANPWPYHGVESESLDKNNASEHREDSSNIIDVTISSSEAGKKPPREPRAELLGSKDAVGLDGVTTEQGYHRPLHANNEQQPPNSNLQWGNSQTMASKPSYGPSTYVHTGSASNSPATSLLQPRIPGNVHRDSTSESLSMFLSQ